MLTFVSQGARWIPRYAGPFVDVKRLLEEGFASLNVDTDPDTWELLTENKYVPIIHAICGISWLYAVVYY